jgi:transmembrane sensor
LFDVKHDAAHPFIVETFACEVEVLGTKFNVKANEKTRDFATALLRGRLKVTNVRNPSERIMMHTDDMVCLKEGGLVLTKIDDPDDYLWAEGFINIRSSSFEELMKRLEKTYGTRIIIERKTCPHLEVIRGKIPISMGLDYVLRTLQKFTPFEYVRDNDANVIRIR